MREDLNLTDLYARPLDSATLHEATDRILDAITSQLEELRGEKAPAVRFDSRIAGVPEIGNPHSRRPRKSARTRNGRPS